MVQTGLNSEVEHQGRVFHVQTESIQRSAAVVETLIYCGGQILVRMTAPLADIAERANLADDDVEHALKLQHWGLVRKVQRGMLGDEQPDPPAEAPPEPRATRPVTPADLSGHVEQSVGDLLDELKQKIGDAHRRAVVESAEPRVNVQPNGTRLWWERYTGRVSVVVRW